ncbi:SDR family NAD(P)-dependent oxidoreductase [Ramlibacter sp.]|uniref:SDR family NAD(P)-dependent oxidoreductase n=1 Tax=Ramlibacter sp. TaxID=1917967 RepID=UPI003D0DD16C
MNTAPLQGKVALVTGSTGGVGYYVAEKLLRDGATLILNSRTAKSGEPALAKMKEISPNVHLVLGDCGEKDVVLRVAKEAAAITGHIDILVSSGAQGRVPPKPFADMALDDIVEAYQSRFFPRIFPVSAALPYMREKGGCVVLIGTDAARHPTPGESVVGAVGAGVILMTKALAKEFSRWNIRVNSVSMTLTSDTPSWDRIFGGEAQFQSKLFTKLSEKFPSGRPPSAEEVARVVAFLATDESAQVTGQTISVNGGLSFGGW